MGDDEKLLAVYSTLREETLLRIQQRNKEALAPILLLGVLGALSEATGDKDGATLRPLLFVLHPMLSACFAIRWATEHRRVHQLTQYVASAIEPSLPVRWSEDYRWFRKGKTGT